MFSIHLKKKKDQKIFLHQHITLVHEKFQTKKVLKVFRFFPFQCMYRVSGAVVGGNSLPIGEHLSTVKN
jgi:hypothetical protein